MTNLIVFISFYLYVFVYSGLYIPGSLKELCYSNLQLLGVSGSQRSALTSLIQTPTSHGKKKRKEKRGKEARGRVGRLLGRSALGNQLIFGKPPPFQNWNGRPARKLLAESNILTVSARRPSFCSLPSAGNSLLILHLLSITGTNKSGG